LTQLVRKREDYVALCWIRPGRIILTSKCRCLNSSMASPNENRCGPVH